MPLNGTCLACSAPFETIPSRIKAGKGRYCSKPCYRVGRRSRREIRSCAQCGATVDRPPSTTKASPQVFCSHPCYTSYRKAEALASLQEPQATRLPNGCLIFNGHKNGNGYGQVMIDGVQRQAHALAWEIANGRPLPDGYLPCHNCPGGDNPSCVEPSHLWAGTHQENMDDRNIKGRTARGERQGTAKLTDAAVREIRLAYGQDGVTLQHLADKYGVGKSTIARVVHGTHWSHVSP